MHVNHFISWRPLAAVLLTLLLPVACTQGVEPLGLNLVSPQQETQLGLEAWQQIRQQEQATSDAALQQRIRGIGQRLVQATGSDPAAWEFVVFQNKQVNAFALPGGKVGVYTGLIALAENDAQLGAVIGHEIGHVVAHHPAKRVSSQLAAQAGLSLAQVGLSAAGVTTGAAEATQLLGLGAQYGVVLPHSRTQEYEADALGMEIMARAGYDPREALRFWARMDGSEGGGRPGWAEFLSTHPVGANRLAAMERELPRAMGIYGVGR
jgi:predicted Zn-dependent protease